MRTGLRLLSAMQCRWWRSEFESAMSGVPRPPRPAIDRSTAGMCPAGAGHHPVGLRARPWRAGREPLVAPIPTGRVTAWGNGSISFPSNQQLTLQRTSRPIKRLPNCGQMSSLLRIEASKANGAKSHGPVSPEGKLAPALNSAASTVPVTPEGFSHLIRKPGAGPVDGQMSY
jgi:hypothetical protein